MEWVLSVEFFFFDAVDFFRPGGEFRFICIPPLFTNPGSATAVFNTSDMRFLHGFTDFEISWGGGELMFFKSKI